jgi:hypothetical protein
MRDHLLARLTTGVGALVPAVDGLRAISWGERIAKAGFPALVLTQVTPGREYDHGGHDGLDRPLIQIDVMTRTVTSSAIEALNTLCSAVIAEMESQDDVTVGGVTVRFHHAFLVNDQGPMTEDVGGAGSDVRVVRRMMEFEMMFETV